MKTDAKHKPSLKRLVYLLRHKETWPRGFTWYFGSCLTCAMGLSARFWNYSLTTKKNNSEDAMDITGEQFGLSRSCASTLFGLFSQNTEDDGGLSVKKIDTVTPEMVADRIDEYLVVNS